MSAGIDICLLTETWLKSRDAVTRAELKPTGYDFKGSPRPSGRTGGGIGIMYKNCMECNVVSSGDQRSFEFVNYEVTYEKTKLSVHAMYRPPYSTNHPVSTDVFFQKLEQYL